MVKTLGERIATLEAVNEVLKKQLLEFAVQT